MAALEALPCFEVPTEGMSLPSVLNRQFFHSFEHIFIHLFISSSMKKSEHKHYTLLEFFHCIRCPANILPDKGPPNTKEENWPFMVTFTLCSTVGKRLMGSRHSQNVGLDLANVHS